MVSFWTVHAEGARLLEHLDARSTWHDRGTVAQVDFVCDTARKLARTAEERDAANLLLALRHEKLRPDPYAYGLLGLNSHFRKKRFEEHYKRCNGWNL